MSQPRLLLGLTGLTIPGGIAAVSRTIVRALDDETRAGRIDRVDRVLLHETAPGVAPVVGRESLAGGSQVRFALQMWRERLLRRPDHILFDFIGLTRCLQLPLPAPSSPYSVVCHGIELTRAIPGSSHHRGLSGAQKIIANSDTTADSIATDFPELAERVRVASLCIDPDMTEAWTAAGHTEDARAEAAQLRRERPVVLIVSRMVAEERGKGHDELIEAWSVVRAAVPAAELWLVGGGDDVARLEAKTREYGVEQVVRFLGHVSDEELARCYQRASLFAMPSRQEGFGLVYAEAMWHGVPCLASRDDAGAEVVRDGATGVLVPYGDVAAIRAALIALLADPARLEAMGTAARGEATERFGYERFARDFLAAAGL